MLWFEIVDWLKSQSLDAEFNFYIERKLGKRWYSIKELADALEEFYVLKMGGSKPAQEET